MRASGGQSPIEFWLGPAVRRPEQPRGLRQGACAQAGIGAQEYNTRTSIRGHWQRLMEGRFDAPDLERSPHLRPSYHPGKTLHRYRGEGCTVPPPAQQLHDSHSKQTVLSPSRTNCGLERRRPRLRICEGQVRSRQRRGLGQRSARYGWHGQRDVIRRPQRDRPDLLRKVLLPRAGRGWAEGVPAPPRNDGRGDKGCGRQGRDQGKGTPRRGAPVRWDAGHVHAVLRR